MKANVGSVDRIIRFILGVIIILSGIFFKNWWGVAGVILLFTAAVKMVSDLLFFRYFNLEEAS